MNAQQLTPLSHGGGSQRSDFRLRSDEQDEAGRAPRRRVRLVHRRHPCPGAAEGAAAAHARPPWRWRPHAAEARHWCKHRDLGLLRRQPVGAAQLHPAADHDGALRHGIPRAQLRSRAVPRRLLHLAGTTLPPSQPLANLRLFPHAPHRWSTTPTQSIQLPSHPSCITHCLYLLRATCDVRLTSAPSTHRRPGWRLRSQRRRASPTSSAPP